MYASDVTQRKKQQAMFTNFITMLTSQSGCTYSNCTTSNCIVRYPTYEYRQDIDGGAKACGDCSCIQSDVPIPPVPPPTNIPWFAKVTNDNTIDRGETVASDNSENLYFTGSYTNTPTIYNIVNDSSSPVPHTPTITLTNVSINSFLVKYNSSGVIQWATQICGDSQSSDSPLFVSSDGTDIYITRSFLTNITYYNGVTSGSPSASSITLTNVGSQNAISIAKYNGSTGAVIWATKITSSTDNVEAGPVFINNNSIFINASSANDISVYDAVTTGDTGASVTTYTAASLSTDVNLLVKCNMNGAIIWTNVVQTLASGSMGVGDITFDSSNNIYWFFYYNDQLTFYNQNGRSAAVPAGSTLSAVSKSMCIVKYNSSGNYQTSTTISGPTNTIATRIKCNASNELICSISSDNPVTLFNPSNVSVMSSAALSGTTNTIIFKYSAALVPLWITQVANVVLSDENANANIEIDSSNNIYIIGNYTGDIIPYGWNGSASVSTGTTITFNNLGGPINSNTFILKYTTAGAYSSASKITGVSFPGICKLTSTDLYIAGSFAVSAVIYNLSTTGDPTIILMTQTSGLDINAFLFALPLN